MDRPSPAAAWVFGNQPLPQTLALAPILRRLSERSLSLEQEDEGVARSIEELSATERALAQRGPGDPTPRIGPSPRADQRVYLDHGRDIGKYNPCFPEYEIRVEGERVETCPIAGTARRTEADAASGSEAAYGTAGIAACGNATGCEDSAGWNSASGCG